MQPKKRRWWVLWSVLCVTTAIALPAQTFTTLHSFDGADGGNPGGLVRGTDGSFYGTAAVGGASDSGTVFKITPSGTLKTLYSFCAQSGCPDGETPVAELLQATDGNFYGTTEFGGANFCLFNGLFMNFCGTVFKITPGGTLTTLYNFCAQVGCTDGYIPNAGLIQAADGNFYGTTELGGGNGGGPGVGFPGRGTVFKITPSGTLTTLYSFCSQSGCPDGDTPVAGLIQAADGSFYGTTELGGANTYGEGTVFRITPSGTLTTLYSFCSQGTPYCTDGELPEAGLVQTTNGDFYGTTASGGANNCSSGSGCGTVFKMTLSGTLATLYSFCALGYPTCPDGYWPTRLIQATDGNLYGTTIYGGAYSYGTVFKMTPGGTLTTLYSFCSQSGCPDGDSPTAGLIQAADGSFYGTTASGGANGDGTIFSLSVGSGPSVPAVNAGGVLNSGSYTTQGVAPGSVVSIFGTDLAASTAAASAIPLPTALSDVTSVRFNNIPAGLYFVSQNQINAQLPFNVLPDQDSGTVDIVVIRSSGTSAPGSVTVVPASPGIFTTTANGLGQAFAYDNTTEALAAPPFGAIGGFATAPISVSSGHALIVACTGLGSVTPSIDNYVAASDGTLRYTLLQPTVLIGGVPALPIYSVLSPQFVSEYQIGVTPASNTPTGNAVSLQIQIGGVTTTDQVTIAVTQ